MSVKQPDNAANKERDMYQYWMCCRVFAEWHFGLRKICAISRNKIFFRTFAHEAEQLLRNIPHCSASHETTIEHICLKLYAQNSWRKKKIAKKNYILRKN